jgi:methyltransferase
MDGRYYKRQIEAVVDEIREIPEHHIFLVDDEPFVDPKRMWGLGEAIRDAKLDKEFFAYARIDSLLRDVELMRFWHSIGLRRLLFGIETIFEHELKEYNKRQQRDQIVKGLRVAREIGISLFCNFIVSTNYTRQEFEDLVRFIRDNQVDYPSFTILTPIPGIGADYDTVIEKQPNGRPNWDFFDLQHAVVETAMPREEFMKEFENLYEVFSLDYLRCESPLTVDSYTQRSEELRRAYMAVAAHVLGIKNFGRSSAGDSTAEGGS